MVLLSSKSRNCSFVFKRNAIFSLQDSQSMASARIPKVSYHRENPGTQQAYHQTSQSHNNAHNCVGLKHF